MGWDTSKRERTRVRELAREYTNEGYEVKVEPGADDRPAFLRHFQPDIIAERGDEKIVVEVKSRTSVQNDDQLQGLAAAVESAEGWRLELVLTNPRTTQDQDRGPIRFETVQQRLGQAYRLHDQPDGLVPAYLLLWIAVEATLLLHLERATGVTRAVGPQRLLKEALSLGALTDDEYRHLQSLAMVRNALVHGVDIAGLSQVDFKRYFETAEKVMKVMSVGVGVGPDAE